MKNDLAEFITSEWCIACIYNDIFIGLAKGIKAEGAISEELKVKWKEESEENIRTLYAQ